MKKPLLQLLGLELAYWIPARLLVHNYHGSEISKEILWTAIRLASAAAIYRCFRKVMWPEGEKREIKIDGLLLATGLAFVLVPGLTQNAQYRFPANYVFALTSLAVGLREEMVYRGVLQRVLTERWGLWAALVASNICFIFYHYGALLFTPYNVFQFFAAGSILGLIYHRTNSLACVIILHAAYDAIQCFTPLLHPPLSLTWGVVLLLVILALLGCATFLSKNKTGSA